MQLLDWKYSLRSIRKSLGSSLICILVLALGIGACTAVFSIVEAVLLNPPPFPKANNIYMIWLKSTRDLKLGYSEFPLHGTQFQFIDAHKRGFEYVAAFKPDQFNIALGSSGQRLDGIRASADFFRVMGVEPLLGRGFSPEDDRPGTEHEVVLNYSLWSHQFGSDKNIVGREVSLNSEKYTVIGVMPPSFSFPRGGEMPKSFEMPSQPSLWVPLALPAHPLGPSVLMGIGRTRPGVSYSQAVTELDIDRRGIDAKNPAYAHWFDFVATPLAIQLSGDLRPRVLLLFASVLAVLLITCANVANLFLAKSMGKVKEVAVRVALGASRKQVIRQFLMESLLLGVGGSVLGLACAGALIKGLQAMDFSRVPRLHDASLDARAIVFSIGIALATSVLFGMFPALEISGGDFLEALRSREQKHAGASTQKFRNGLLIGEVALTVVLVIGGTLLLRSFVNLIRTSPGFASDHLLTMELTLPPTKYRSEQDIVGMYTRLLNRLSTVPGIEAASLGKALPMSGDQEATVYYVNGVPMDRRNLPFTQYSLTSADYFRAMEIPLLAGRSFTAADNSTSGKVVVISKSMAALYWKDAASAIGHQVSLPPAVYHDMTVVGVVGDVKNQSMDETPSPQMYVPYTQHPYPSMVTMQFALRTKMGIAQIAKSIQGVVREEDSELPIANVRPMSALIDSSMEPIRFAVMLLGAFAAVAWGLALLGVYAIVSYLVAERMHDMAVRVALGAQQRDVLALVFSAGARLVGFGLLVGLALALGLSRVFGHFMYEVHAVDPLTYAGMAVLVFAASSLAIFMPARRAMRADPMSVLRAE
ncbi:MAG TPA: ABC transporter permease [Terriglobales bacterium]|nr:ABC transporter permease [Terriglobales bacterium]